MNATDGDVAAGGEFARGWKPLIACVLGSACGITAITFYTQSLFVAPVTAEFGWGRGEFLLSYTVLMMVGVVTAPIVGSLIDRIGPLKIGVFSLVGHALGYGLLAITPGSLIVWYATFAFLAVVSAGSLPITWMYVINKWFVTHRGKAIGLTMAGTGFVAFIGPPLVAQAIGAFGWRGAYALTGLAPLVVSLPIVLLFLRLPRRAGEGGAVTEGAPEPLWGYTRAEALRDYRFWALAMALMLTALAAAGLLPNFVPALMDKGMAREAAAQTAAAIGLAVLVGRLAAGFLVDRFWAPGVAAAFFVMPIISILLILFLPVSTPTALAAAVTLGLALGAEVDLLAYVTARYFGSKHFGPIFGGILVFFMLAAGLAPAIYGAVFDATGSYASIMWASIVMLTVSIVLFLTLGRYPEFYAPREAQAPA